MVCDGKWSRAACGGGSSSRAGQDRAGGRRGACVAAAAVELALLSSQPVWMEKMDMMVVVVLLVSVSSWGGGLQIQHLNQSNKSARARLTCCAPVVEDTVRDGCWCVGMEKKVKNDSNSLENECACFFEFSMHGKLSIGFM